MEEDVTEFFNYINTIGSTIDEDIDFDAICSTIDDYERNKNKPEKIVIEDIPDSITYRFTNNQLKFSLTEENSNIKAIRTYSKEIIKIAIEHYGYDKVSWNIDTRIARLTLIIHYPEIKISDGLRTHKMLDVYIIYKFLLNINTTKEYGVIDGYYIDSINMDRGTLDYVEIHNNYYFSHYSNGSEMFCFGYSTAIANQIMELKGVSDSAFKLKNLFYLFDEYLTWESIDGGPFKHISLLYLSSEYSKLTLHTELSTKLNYTLEDIITEELFDSLILPKILTSKIFPYFTFSIYEIFKTLYDNGIVFNSTIYLNLTNGEYVKKHDVRGIINKQAIDLAYKDKFILFKGKKIPIKIVDIIYKDVKDRELNFIPVVSPNVLIEFITKIMLKKLKFNE